MAEQMNQAKELTHIGMGEYAVKHNPATLTSLGLGSCVGVCIYDPVAHQGGLAHVMLPTIIDSPSFKGQISADEILKLNDDYNKYADVAIPKMVEDLKKSGSKMENMKVKIIGGAHMFIGLDDGIQMGKRNVESVKKVLANCKLTIIAEETGGNVGRTVKFDLVTGEVTVKTKDGEKSI